MKFFNLRLTKTVQAQSQAVSGLLLAGRSLQCRSSIPMVEFVLNLYLNFQILIHQVFNSETGRREETCISKRQKKSAIPHGGCVTVDKSTHHLGSRQITIQCVKLLWCMAKSQLV